MHARANALAEKYAVSIMHMHARKRDKLALLCEITHIVNAIIAFSFLEKAKL